MDISRVKLYSNQQTFDYSVCPHASNSSNQTKLPCMKEFLESIFKTNSTAYPPAFNRGDTCFSMKRNESNMLNDKITLNGIQKNQINFHNQVKGTTKRKRVDSQFHSITFVENELKSQKSKRAKPVLEVSDNLEDFKALWKGETYLFPDIFKNREKITSHYIPLFKTLFPEQECRLILCSGNYKQLFKENPHLSYKEKKHAWRLTLFTIDFFEFVKKNL